MNTLSAEEISFIHSALETEFPLMVKGVEKEGLVQAALERSERSLFGTSHYDDVYTKVASIMEGIIRWHIFTDGNKRTGLTIAFSILYINDIYLAIPLDAVRFTVKIAEMKENDEEFTNKLINEIAVWLQEHSTKEPRIFALKVLKHTWWPALQLVVFQTIGLKKLADRKLDHWFAVKGHEDYKLEANQVVNYLLRLMKAAILDLFKSKKKAES